MLFGYRIDPEFDLPKEQRNDRIGWLLYAAVAICGVYLFLGGRFAVDVLQVAIVTILCYGANFYANRRSDLNKLWLWKAVVATVPLHCTYLALLIWSDKVVPQAMTKALVFMPVLLVGFAIESLLIEQIVAYFERRDRQPG